LELASSFGAQQLYQATVPYVSVPNEVFNQFDDLIPPDSLDEWGPPVFSMAEIDALRQFHEILEYVSDSTPDPMPPLADTLRIAEWTELRGAAKETLLVFRQRGKLQENP
jgi:hypothetical protein